jgi:hypothetical protein
MTGKDIKKTKLRGFSPQANYTDRLSDRRRKGHKLHYSKC